jgi:DNA-binding transcriptional regulator GbsR (MarR family)
MDFDLESLMGFGRSVLTEHTERTIDPGMTPIPDSIRQYVDDTGLLLENAGLQRIAGQVLGWLQVCDPETQSLADIVTALGISKGSASTTTRFLEHVGIVEKTILPGERRDYYRVCRDAWHRFMQTRVETMRRLRRNADQGLRVLAGESPQRRDRLERMRRLYTFLEREMPKLLERFDEQEGADEVDDADASLVPSPFAGEG